MEVILKEHEKHIDETAHKILNEIKFESGTYGEVRKKLDRLRVSTRFNSGIKFEHLFNKINELLEKEKNDLPLTNRSK